MTGLLGFLFVFVVFCFLGGKGFVHITKHNTLCLTKHVTATRNVS